MDKYEALEGKRVKYWYSDERFVWAIVVNIDPDIGVTVVKESDREFNCLCYNGPLSPRWKTDWSKEDYYESFQDIYEQIEYGSVNLEDDGGSRKESIPREFCPFNQ